MSAGVDSVASVAAPARAPRAGVGGVAPCVAPAGSLQAACERLLLLESACLQERMLALVQRVRSTELGKHGGGSGSGGNIGAGSSKTICFDNGGGDGGGERGGYGCYGSERGGYGGSGRGHGRGAGSGEAPCGDDRGGSASGIANGSMLAGTHVLAEGTRSAVQLYFGRSDAWGLVLAAQLGEQL